MAKTTETSKAHVCYCTHGGDTCDKCGKTFTRTEASLEPIDLAAVRKRADRMERDHECPHDPKRAGWCAKEPCGTMQTVMQLRTMAGEIERLRTSCSKCGEAIEWRSYCDRPYPANKDGSLHRCAARKSKVNEMLGAPEATLDDDAIDRALRAQTAVVLQYGLCHPCRTKYPKAHECSGVETFGHSVKCVCPRHHPDAPQERDRAGLRAAIEELSHG